MATVMKCCWYTMGINRSNCFEIFEERGCQLKQVQAENVDHRSHGNQQRCHGSQWEPQPCWSSQASTLKAKKERHRNLLSLQGRQTRARRDENQYRMWGRNGKSGKKGDEKISLLRCSRRWRRGGSRDTVWAKAQERQESPADWPLASGHAGAAKRKEKKRKP